MSGPKWTIKDGVAKWDGPVNKTISVENGMISIRCVIPDEPLDKPFDMLYLVPASVMAAVLKVAED